MNLNCQNCNGTIDIDIDDMQAYCPYCGKKLLFDVDQMKRILEGSERIIRAQERTKRAKLELEYREKKEKRENSTAFRIMIGSVISVFLCILILFILGEMENREHKSKNEIRVSISSQDLTKSSCEDALQALKSAGFENIELIENNDIILGIMSKENSVESVSINGDSDFSENDWFPMDAVVRITYHAKD